MRLIFIPRVRQNVSIHLLLYFSRVFLVLAKSILHVIIINIIVIMVLQLLLLLLLLSV